MHDVLDAWKNEFEQSIERTSHGIIVQKRVYHRIDWQNYDGKYAVPRSSIKYLQRVQHTNNDEGNPTAKISCNNDGNLSVDLAVSFSNLIVTF